MHLLCYAKCANMPMQLMVLYFPMLKLELGDPAEKNQCQPLFTSNKLSSTTASLFIVIYLLSIRRSCRRRRPYFSFLKKFISISSREIEGF